MSTLLQINSVINSGSTGRITEDIGKIAIKNGWNSYIGYGRYAKNSESKIIKIGNQWDIITHGILTRAFDMHGLGSKKATMGFIREIEKISPDIIHLHNIHGYYLNYKVLFDFFKGVQPKIIWTMHDCWPFTGHCSYFDSVNCHKWKSQCNNCPQIKAYPKAYIDNSRQNFLKKQENFNSLKYLNIVSVSNWLKKNLESSFLKYQSITVINNGIDLQSFYPTISSKIKLKYKIPLDKTILLGVASVWDSRKGLEDFIKLSKLVDKSISIVLIGLKQNQIKLLPSKIIGITRTENVRELAQLYSCADIFLNLTYEDNFPTTNLEALACGTPVLTYNTGGSIESVTPNTGFIVEKGNLMEVIQIVKQLQTIGKDNYSNQCMDQARNHYNKDDRYNDYIKLYNSLIVQ